METRAYDCAARSWRTDYVIMPDGSIWRYEFSVFSGNRLVEKVNWKLSRFTGHLDKYKNEIYEYHIVKITALSNYHHQRGAWEIRTVKYFMGNPCVCWKCQDTGPALYPLIVDYDIEIIGNVFENLELLEE